MVLFSVAGRYTAAAAVAPAKMNNSARQNNRGHLKAAFEFLRPIGGGLRRPSAGEALWSTRVYPKI
jgi:hypothetical protein